MAELKTKALSELLDYHFNIPSYQRGYRWDDQQVTDLLNDLLEYSNTKNGEYYCLQPITVKKNDKLSSQDNIVYDVIDGQQRLTTLFLILTYLSDVRKVLHRSSHDKMYSLDFEIRFKTNEKSSDDHYLNNRTFVSDDIEYKSDINKFFIYNAYRTISKWFQNAGDVDSEILWTLLGVKGNEQSGVVKVIWYDLSDSKESSTDVFARLNYGKIPLTDAELIKAILLECKDENNLLAKEKAFRISCEWDEMEKKLHEPQFWGFLTTSDTSNSRMSFILDKVARDIQSEKHYEYNEEKAFFDYHVVNRFVEEDDSAHAIDELWKRIQHTFSVFENWYNDNEIYHKIGYLTSSLAYTYRNNPKELNKQSKSKIDSFYKTYINSYKITQFNDFLSAQIASEVKLSANKNIEDLNYNDDPRELVKILLLFNVHTAMCEKREKYPFDRQKKENITSLEHIHPQHLDISKIKNTENCHMNVIKPWIEGLNGKIHNDQISKIYDFIDYEYYLDNFDQFLNLIPIIDNHFLSLVEMKEDDIHLISNMALVSKETNSALSNNFLDKKRQILRGTPYYVPCCTWIVFNKSYSDSPEDLIFWHKSDRDAYLEAIKNVYYQYVKPVTDHNHE